MRIITLIFCLLLINVSSTMKVFEGELIYYHNMKMNSKDYTKSINFYNTLTVTYKNKNYIKLTNKKDYEKKIFIDSLKKTYVIYKDNLNKSKKLSMNEDNLNFGKIISLSKSDTILNFNNEDCELKKLFAKKEYGNETYVYSESKGFKLIENRNILRNVGEQIYPEEIASELNNSNTLLL